MFDSSSRADSCSRPQLEVLLQQIDSFLISPPNQQSFGSAPDELLVNLLSSAAAEGADQQLHPVDAALCEAFSAWLKLTWRTRGSATTSKRHAQERRAWLAAAALQWRILQDASSPSMARLLMGAGAVPDEYFRCGRCSFGSVTHLRVVLSDSCHG
jgi:hypothetical protein